MNKRGFWLVLFDNYTMVVAESMLSKEYFTVLGARCAYFFLRKEETNVTLL